MSFKTITGVALSALMLSAVAASAQVGGGSIGGSGTIGGSGSVGGATIGGGTSGANIGAGNQSPAPGSPVLPSDTAGTTASGRTDRVPGAARPTGNDAVSDQTGARGTNRTSATGVTPPQSIIDQPETNIPSPDQPGSNPADVNLRDGTNNSPTTAQ